MNQTEDGVEGLKRRVLDGAERIARLTMECRLRAAGSPLSIEYLLQTVYAAVEVFGLDSRKLPRGYTVTTRRNNGSVRYLQLGGKEADPAQVALDVATGWLDELASDLQRRVDGIGDKPGEAVMRATMEGPRA